MRAIVTCGPSYEPIDEVRRLTNFSSGELGTLLAMALARAGVETVCLRGAGSTFTSRRDGGEVREFSTNSDLAALLRHCAGEKPYAALYHAAALADYRVAAIEDAAGLPMTGSKLATDRGALTLHLEPAVKILPQLRAWFPTTRLYGWKYELDGTREQALARATRQIAECGTDACILNGRAYGEGFAHLHPDGRLQHFDSKTALCEHLVQELSENREFLLQS